MRFRWYFKVRVSIVRRITRMTSLAYHIERCSFSCLSCFDPPILYALPALCTALSTTGRAIKIESENVAALDMRGRALYWLAEVDSATAHFKEALKHDPEHKECKEWFRRCRAVQKRTVAAEAAAAEGRHEDAATEWRAAAELDSSHVK
jgi:tetratricopeptide (TPR) repeat protein